MVAGSHSDVDALQKHLNKLSKTKRLGGRVLCSGCHFVRGWQKETSMIGQESCIENMEERFVFSTESDIPASTTTDLRSREELKEEFEGPSRQLIGGLVPIANMTRPYIMNAVR